MPERTGPNPYDNWANDINRRLRDVERKNPGIPDSSNPLQTYEDGSPLGDTFHLDFGANISATPLGGGYVLVEGSTVGAGPWDAIVDASIAATDTDVSPPIFKASPGEALAYLTTLGFTRANVFVRPGTYTESANVTPPANVFLFGAPGGGEDLVIWNRGANFTMSATRWHLCNITVNLYEMTTLTTPFGTTVSRFYTENCFFDFKNGTEAHSGMRFGDVSSASASFCYFVNCAFDGIRSLGANVWIVGGDYRTRGEGTSIATNSIFVNALAVAGSAEAIWTLPPTSVISISGATSCFRSGAQTPGDTLVLQQTSPSDHSVFIDAQGAGISVRVNLTGTDYTNIVVKGSFVSVLIPSATCRKTIDCSVNHASGDGIGLDLMGPAAIDVHAVGSALKLRGKAISGHISGDKANGGASTLLSFIDADYCNIMCAADGEGTAGRKGYDFDANSDNNILDFAGDTTFAVASTDAGAGNLIRTT